LHLPFKEREYFTENLSLLLKSAVPIGEALESLQTSVKNKAFKKAIGTMMEDIEAGYNLADALERSGIAGSQTLALIRLGEASGHLVENLELAAKQEEKRHVFASKVRSAFIYPAFVITLTIIIGLAVAWFLLPRLATTFAQLQVKLPPISQVLINFGTFLKEHGIVAVPGAVIVVSVIGYVLFGAPKTKHIGRSLLLHTPGISRLIHETEIAQFGYLLGTLMDAGLSVTQALRLLAQASTTPAYEHFYVYLAQRIDDGYTFKASLASYKQSESLLPLAVQQMVIAGERSGSLPDVLMTIGRTYESKADLTTQNLETIIEPIMLVAVAGGVMVVAVSVILPIYSLVGGLNQ
jgi:type IV pilus assembly protein PilC